MPIYRVAITVSPDPTDDTPQYREVTADSDLLAIGEALKLAHTMTPPKAPKEVWVHAWGKVFHVIETPNG